MHIQTIMQLYLVNHRGCKIQRKQENVRNIFYDLCTFIVTPGPGSYRV